MMGKAFVTLKEPRAHEGFCEALCFAANPKTNDASAS